MTKRFYLTALIAVGLLAALLTWFFWNGQGTNSDQIQYEEVSVTRSDLSEEITATGTVQATQTVDVGTQVSGVIEKIYANFNDHVKKNQVLAELDRLALKEKVNQSEANVRQAENEVKYLSNNLERLKKLTQTQSVAPQEIETAEYKLENAQVALIKARSELHLAKINLNYTTIRSPIDGIIIDRAVDAGQTVAASLNAPVLFTIAENFDEMYIEASIDEADIGLVQEGQSVSFTVDAFPDSTFSGSVQEKRLSPETSSNVVTYTVIIKAQNPDHLLIPGLTANLSIRVKYRPEALNIPLPVLSFTPPMPDSQPPVPEGKRPPKDFSPPQNNAKTHTVWVLKDGHPHPRRIQIGLQTDTAVEILSGLQEKDLVILRQKVQDASRQMNQTRSPFMPTGPKRKKSGTGRGPS